MTYGQAIVCGIVAGFIFVLIRDLVVSLSKNWAKGTTVFDLPPYIFCMVVFGAVGAFCRYLWYV